MPGGPCLGHRFAIGAVAARSRQPLGLIGSPARLIAMLDLGSFRTVGTTAAIAAIAPEAAREAGLALIIPGLQSSGRALQSEPVDLFREILASDELYLAR